MYVLARDKCTEVHGLTNSGGTQPGRGNPTAPLYATLLSGTK